MIQHFREMWHQEYVGTLINRSKWRNQQRNLETGDLSNQKISHLESRFNGDRQTREARVQGSPSGVQQGQIGIITKPKSQEPLVDSSKPDTSLAAPIIISDSEESEDEQLGPAHRKGKECDLNEGVGASEKSIFRRSHIKMDSYRIPMFNGEPRRIGFHSKTCSRQQSIKTQQCQQLSRCFNSEHISKVRDWTPSRDTPW